MSDKTELLQDILSSLDENENGMIEKLATDANALSNTENPEARKKVPTQVPTKSEGKLGLSVLSKNKHEEDVRKYDGVSANKPDGQGTENISPKTPPAEPGVMFEKRAADEAISAIYEAAGLDLQKVASTDAEMDMLLKVAEDTMNELQDLEKVAEAMAEATAKRFIEIINEQL
jgi:hypothetical protein